MPNCWYCKIERTLGDGHMYKCAQDRVRENKMKLAMEDALTMDLETPCTVEECNTVFKGSFSKIVVDSVTHFNKYHREEL